MAIVFLIIGGFITAVCLSELALRGTKLQSGLAKAIVVHAVIAGSLIAYLLIKGNTGWAALIIFWAGAFLTWFGVRSYMESSILLRMLFLLRRGPVPKKVLLEEYESHYGQAQRLEELFRGSLLRKTSEGIRVTQKGNFILRIVSILK